MVGPATDAFPLCSGENKLTFLQLTVAFEDEMRKNPPLHGTWLLYITILIDVSIDQ